MAPDEVHVTWARVDRVPPLPVTDEERSRAAAFRHAGDARRFLAARGLLREALSERVGVAPLALRFGRACPACGSAEHGKPFLMDAPAEVRFNASHAGDLVVVALAAREVGVDVERVDPAADIDALAPRVLSPAERARLDATPRPERAPLFFRLWACKEAYLKLEGHGLALPLERVDALDVPPQGRALARLVGEGEAWLAPLALPEDHAGCVALAGGPARVVLRERR